MNNPLQFTLTRPDDWHLHLRDHEAMASVLPHTAHQFHRAIVMPNLKPPVTTTEMALAYRERILAALPAGMSFTPLMTLYLTESMAAEELVRAKQSGHVQGVKLYPAGATTHSEAGINSLEKIYPLLETLADIGLPLLIHGEATDPTVDVFDREKVFIERHLVPIVERFPKLRLVLEHITTQHAVEFVLNTGNNVAATITPHHLLMNRNSMFQGGIRPHHYCLPVLKRERHRLALIEAATSGKPKFFLGTDSAPHARNAKESACGCAGIYSAHAAIELYAQVFEQAGALDKLEGFASFFGADFYGLERNTDTITLVKSPWKVADHYKLGDDELIPLYAGQEIQWQLQE